MPPDVSKAEPMSSEMPDTGDSTFSVNPENSAVMNRVPSTRRHGVANGNLLLEFYCL